MPKSKPQAGPGEGAEFASAAATSGESRPDQLPPGGGATGAAKGDCGCGGGAGAGMMGGSEFLSSGAGDTAPSIRPPGIGGVSKTAWVNNKLNTGLLAINQDSHLWGAVDGGVSERHDENSDSGI